MAGQVDGTRMIISVFSRPDMKELADVAIGEVRDAAFRFDRETRTYALLTLGSAILFELLNRSQISEVSVLGVRLQANGFLAIVAPLLVAVFFSQNIFAIGLRNFHSSLYRRLIYARYSPTGERAEMLPG